MASLPPALRTPAAQNLIAATAAGLAVLARPARFPAWTRRALSLANTAGTAGSVFLGANKSKGESAGASGALGLKPVKGTAAETASLGSALAAAAGGLSLITSGVGLKLEHKAENYLASKGLKHPRIWVAVGVVVVVFAVKTIQDAAAQKATDKAKQMAARVDGGGTTTNAATLLKSPAKHNQTTGMSAADKAAEVKQVPDPKVDSTPASEKAATDPEDVAADTGRPVADAADN